jgi:hypothetical protein
MSADPVTAAVQYLRRQQRPDGGFDGLLSHRPADFRSAKPHPTTFFTALLLTSLQDAPDCQPMLERAAGFLLQHKSRQWSWNYLTRGSVDQHGGSYPDDLDDTACALAALYRQRPEVIDGTALGQVSQLLIANEEAPGGPYATWLVDRQALPAWHDIDLAVNANIAYFLSLQGVALQPLTAYASSAIEQDNLASTYYVGEAPLLYFLARWYRGPALAQLRRRTARALEAAAGNALALGLLINAGCRLDCPADVLEAAVQRLLGLRTGNHWPAAAFYVGAPVQGQSTYAGSASLTTGFAVEALLAFGRLQHSIAPPPRQEPSAAPAGLLARVIADSKAIPEPALRLRYRSFARLLIANDHDQQITAMATATAAAARAVLPARTLRSLNLASLHGWMAYTIYDDVIDGEANRALLGVANFAQRQMLGYFRAARPADNQFQALVAQTLLQVDSANTWEVVKARATVRGRLIRLHKLPDYGDYSQLWRRSWGHMLAASGVLAALGYSPGTPEQQQLQAFFRHFLIARQLNDDAHDWEADLSRGHISAVVALLLKSYCGEPVHCDLGREADDLQLHFWQQTINQVAELIRCHAAAAEAALKTGGALQDTTVYRGWLASLRTAAEAALTARDEAQAFIRTYPG